MTRSKVEKMLQSEVINDMKIRVLENQVRIVEIALGKCKFLPRREHIQDVFIYGSLCIRDVFSERNNI